MDLFSSVAQNQGHGRVGASPWTSCQSVAGLNLSKKLMKFKKKKQKRGFWDAAPTKNLNGDQISEELLKEPTHTV